MTDLFVIGNGFDSSHKLKTSYDDFRQYLLSNYPEINMDEFIVPDEIHQQDGGIAYNEVQVLSMLFYLINEAESDTEKWSNVESSLGNLNFDEAFEYYDDILDKDGDVDLFKTANRNEDRASQLVIPTITIQQLFAQWINTIDLISVIPKEEFRNLISIQDYFLTFNYTETLEEVYKIHQDNICHIHGKQNEEIFFGHGNFEDYTERYMQKYIGSQDSLSKINQQLRKRTDEALENNLDFFNSLEEADIKEIYSYGFSFSKVDMVYLKEICNRINTEDSIWYFNDYDALDHNKYKEVLRKCGYKGAFNTFHI
jgi:hypothetical protein